MNEVRKSKIDIALIIIALLTSLLGLTIQIVGVVKNINSLVFLGQSIVMLGVLIHCIKNINERTT